MSDASDSALQRSVYSIGATDGFWVGLAMGTCVLCMITSCKIPFLSLVGLILFFVTPFIAWRFVKRGWINSLTPASFSAVWLHGICIFLFGSIIMALMMYLALKVIVPGWIEIQTSQAVALLADDPNTAHEAKVLQQIINSGELPTPIYTAVSSIWLTAFSGSMLSMIFAFILTRTAHFRNLRFRNSKNHLNNDL